MDVLDQLDQLGPLLATVVGGIQADQLDNPTPCTNFTVGGVLEHMIGGATTLVANVEAFASEALEPMRGGDTFAAATEAAPSATPIERLAAFTGRRT